MHSTQTLRRSTPATLALLGLAFVPLVSAGQTIYGYSGNRIRGSSLDNSTTQFSTSGWRIGCNATDDACPREQQLTMVSKTTGSTFTLPFTGTGVQVNGSVIVSSGATQALSASSVGDYLSLTLDSVPYSPAGLTGNDYNQVIFNSTTIADGAHTLVLTVKGGATVGVRYVTVNTLDAPVSSSVPVPSSTAAAVDSASSAAPVSTDVPKSDAAPISSGDIGAFVATAVMAVVLLIVGIVLFLRRKKNVPESDTGKEMVDMKEKDGDAHSDDGSTRGLTTLAKDKSSPKWEGSTRRGSVTSSLYKAKALTKPQLAALSPSNGRRDDDQVWDKIGHWRERSEGAERDYPKVNAGVGENLRSWRERTGADKYESGTTDTSLPSFADSDRARKERADEKEREWRRLEPRTPTSPSSEQLPVYRPAQEDRDARRPREREVMERKDTQSSWARERLARREREEMTSPINQPRPDRGDSRSTSRRPNSREAPVFSGRENDQGRLMVQQVDREGRHRSDTSILQQVSRSDAW